MPTEGAPVRLIVFSDDWGRHPSSCQHLVRHLLPRFPTLWVNTIGTRRPTISRADFARAAGKFRRWLAPRAPEAMGDAALPPASRENLRVVAPLMWPGFRTPTQRRFNARQVTRAVETALGDRAAGERRIVVTTLPITADLVGRLPVDRWVYYCVDDFEAWPGLDAAVMREMEREQAAKVDAVVAVSETLRTRMKAIGRDASLLTHGIDAEHWARVAAAPAPPLPDRFAEAFREAPRPLALFWGVVDRRLDPAWCEALAGTGGSLLLVGPVQAPDPRLAKMSHVRALGPAGYDELPALAAAADVLVMPYDDLPVTRAMQPLKFKEYLATGRPAVVRALPATAEWADCADVAATAEAFVAAVRERAAGGLPVSQAKAREARLATETWAEKARQFEVVLRGGGEASG
ncbi:MAG: glycosyltransferase [Planctomycetota bacterium]|nr:glycosyltransferase [Planctomycetota bacterium]